MGILGVEVIRLLLCWVGMIFGLVVVVILSL